jgi:pimeloyl-ACP methyl ester carboxylesterase
VRRLRAPFVLVGHSKGGLIAARYAARNTKRVSTLVLVSPPIYLAPTELSDGVDRGMMDLHLRAYQYLRLNKTFTLMAARGIQLLLPIPKLVDVTERNWTPFITSLEHSIESQTTISDLAAIDAPRGRHLRQHGPVPVGGGAEDRQTVDGGHRAPRSRQRPPHRHAPRASRRHGDRLRNRRVDHPNRSTSLPGKPTLDVMNPDDDVRLNVARYRVDKLASETERSEDETDTAGQTTMDARAQYVEISIQQAMRRGDFDDLPGAGKPLQNLRQIEDPNWWIRQKIEREKITGLGPPALTLRTENAALDGKLDAVASEPRVREILEDFNRRVIEARRQLQGGPPVVTPPRDIDREVTLWRERRAERRAAADREREIEESALAALTWRQRRRAKRA